MTHPSSVTKDVLFDEDTFFDGRKTDLNNDRIAPMDELVAQISLEPAQAENEKVYEEILCSEQAWESDGSNDDEIQLFNEKDEYELVRAVEEGLITAPRSDVLDSDGNSAFGLYTPFMVVDRAGSSNHRNDDFQGELVDQSDNWNGRLERLQACSHWIGFSMARSDIEFRSLIHTNPSKSHHVAADRVLQYVHYIPGYTPQYGHKKGWLCASDASFGDILVDRKGSQGFIMTLFGGLIAWIANKQHTLNCWF